MHSFHRRGDATHTSLRAICRWRDRRPFARTALSAPFAHPPCEPGFPFFRAQGAPSDLGLSELFATPATQGNSEAHHVAPPVTRPEVLNVGAHRLLPALLPSTAQAHGGTVGRDHRMLEVHSFPTGDRRLAADTGAGGDS